MSIIATGSPPAAPFMALRSWRSGHGAPACKALLTAVLLRGAFYENRFIYKHLI
ncbi:MAG: hypothetical protein ACOH2M_16525 [Cypionkella sp.]